MPKTISKQSLMTIILVAAVAGATLSGYWYWKIRKSSLPEGIALGNGRIESKLVDAAAKEVLRVKQIFVDEGDLVEPGQVLVQLDTITLDGQLAEAKAKVAAAQERLAIAKAAMDMQIEAIASMVGMKGVFKLRTADIFRVVSVTKTTGERIPLSQIPSAPPPGR